jgi:prolyl oligopeptidase
VGGAGRRPVALPPYVEAHEEGHPAGPQEEGEPRAQAQPRPQLVATALRADVPPPPATRADGPTEVLHGIQVADPYRWLEDGASPEVRAWTTAQNQRTRAALDAVPARGPFRERLAELTQAGTALSPSVRGDRLFTIDRWGDRDRAALVVRSIADPAPGPGRILLDPADASGEVTSAIDWYEPSPDGAQVAFGTSTGGDERSTLRVLDVDAGTLLPDAIPHTRAASVAWLPDASGFAYTRYPDPDEVGAEEAGYHRTVWWHRLGDAAAQDAPCFTDLPDKEAWPEVSLSSDGRWLLVHVQRGWSRTDVHLLDRASDRWATVVEGAEATSWFRVDVERERLVGTTTLGASRGRLVAALLGDPQPEHWVDLISEGDDVLTGFALTGEHLLVLRARAGVSSLHHHEPSGAPVGEVGDVTGGLSAVTALASHETTPDLIAIGHTSFTRPDTVTAWRPDAAPVALTSLPGPAVPETDVAQVRYASTDGTEVPMLLVHAPGTVIDGRTPTLLTGYGGFNITETPAWSPFVAAWCEVGGQLAVPGLRGGGEEGEAWHQAGMRANKPQVFADFEAAADWLVAEGRTSRDRLAIRGGSNGGLLVAACEVRRPDLCRAVVCDVPLTDMVRFPRFLIARLWIPEYGDPEVPEELAWLHAYSPYHQVVDGTAYPATLVTTGEEDSRVDPCHARKYAARLQAASTNEVLLRVEPSAGHGQGKPATKQIEERADVLAFLAWHLEIPTSVQD